MGCMEFSVSQYDRHLSPYVCLLCIKIPPIHKKASLDCFSICADPVVQVLHISYFFSQYSFLYVSPGEKIRNT